MTAILVCPREKARSRICGVGKSSPGLVSAMVVVFWIISSSMSPNRNLAAVNATAISFRRRPRGRSSSRRRERPGRRPESLKSPAVDCRHFSDRIDQRIMATIVE